MEARTQWKRLDHWASHAYLGGLWHVFVRLMQLLPQALPRVQILQHAASTTGSECSMSRGASVIRTASTDAATALVGA
jgi:hypothetical protein